TITYAIVNRFLTKLEKEEGGFETRQLARVAVGQVFYIAEARRSQDLDIRERRPFGSVILDVESRPTRQVRLLHESRYNPYEGEISQHTTGLLLDGGRNWFLNVTSPASTRWSGPRSSRASSCATRAAAGASP
ncbi:MAG: LPS assembly protein LptD, partial [Candidatus Tectomicrobia bacterium]|nr:LPS assembly protein LptD [Candidatus Tectomicrobia bacterium]